MNCLCFSSNSLLPMYSLCSESSWPSISCALPASAYISINCDSNSPFSFVMLSMSSSMACCLLLRSSICLSSSSSLALDSSSFFFCSTTLSIFGPNCKHWLPYASSLSIYWHHWPMHCDFLVINCTLNSFFLVNFSSFLNTVWLMRVLYSSLTPSGLAFNSLM